MIRAAAALAVLAAAAPAHGALRFEREDGSAIRFSGKARIWCGPWASDVAEPALHIRVGRRGDAAAWDLAAVRRDIVRGRAIRFPTSFNWDEPRGAQLFVNDGRNEASTNEEEAGGRLFFTRISCRPGRVVAFTVDATIGSEYSDGEEIRVSGTFRGRVRARANPAP